MVTRQTSRLGLNPISPFAVVALVATGLSGLFHAPWVQAVGLTLLAAATLVTVVQRIVHVHRQAVAA